MSRHGDFDAASPSAGHLDARRAHLLGELIDVRRHCSADVESREWLSQFALQRQNIGAGHIGGVDIVAQVPTVSVDDDGLSGEHFFGKYGDDAGFAVRVLPWAVNIRIAERHGLDSMFAGEESQVLLAGPFADSIR